MRTRATRSKKEPLVAIPALPAKGDVQKVKRGLVLEHSETSAEEPEWEPPKRSKPGLVNPTKLSPKTGRMMEVGTGRRVQAEASKVSATAAAANQPAKVQSADQEAAAKPLAKRKPGRPPGKKSAASKLAQASAPARPRVEHSEASLRRWAKEQHEVRNREEDAAVRDAQMSGRFVDLAVHSFVGAIPPSRLVVPEGVSIDFLRRQIQYRVEEHGGNLTADAIELQLKDNYNQMVPALSFNGRGREMTVSDYGLVPGPVGTQHHIWAIFVDDTAAKIQREATARILLPTGASNLHRSPQLASVVAYEGALSPPRAPPQAVAAQRGEQAQQDAALRHEQHMQAASPTTSPRKRQKPNTRWSEEETALLVDVVCVRGTGSWADILDQHRATFHPTRSSVDLKDKWRNLVKAASKPAEAPTRTQHLSREQIVKILEFLHKDDE